MKKEQRLLLRKLCADCIAYGLKPNAELVYVKQELGESVPIRTINRYKSELRSDESTRQWYSDFARINFVKNHQKILEDLERLYDDTNHRIFEEGLKSPRQEGLIIRLKADLKETMLMLHEFGTDTPVIDAIRLKIEGNKKKTEEEPDLGPHHEFRIGNA